jgi:hypothetical protein
MAALLTAASSIQVRDHGPKLKPERKGKSKDAATLVGRHPENAMAHFALSYVSAMPEFCRNRRTSVRRRGPWIPETINSALVR